MTTKQSKLLFDLVVIWATLCVSLFLTGVWFPAAVGVLFGVVFYVYYTEIRNNSYL